MLLIILGAMVVAGMLAKIHDLTKQNQAIKIENEMLWMSNNWLSWDLEKANSELELTCAEYQIPTYSKTRRTKNADTACTTRH